MNEKVAGFLKLAKHHAQATDTSTRAAIRYLADAIGELSAQVEKLEAWTENEAGMADLDGKRDYE